MKHVLYICALLCALSSAPAIAAPGLQRSMEQVGNAKPQPSSFILCHGRDCRIRTRVKLSGGEWGRVASLFPAASARDERQRIKKAIGMLEQMTGKKAGTSGDLGGTFDGAFSKGQMDCEDETMNTGVYLTMLENRKLLRFHRVAGRAHRGYFFNRWPHRAVQVEEKKSHKTFVVDSWFHDNGKPAEIVALQDWENGWRPN